MVRKIGRVAYVDDSRYQAAKQNPDFCFSRVCDQALTPWITSGQKIAAQEAERKARRMPPL
jgi:hypothetical protein